MPGVLLNNMEQPVLPETLKVPEYGFIVAHQVLHLDIDFSTQNLTGHTEILILPQTDDLETIRIDARQCEIKEVKVEGFVAEFDYDDPMKKMDMPSHIAWNAHQYDLQRERIKAMTTENLRGTGALIITIPRGVRIQAVDPFSDKAATPVAQKAAMGVVRAGADGASGPLSATPTLTPKTAAEQTGRWQPLKISIQFANKNWRDGLHFVGMTEGDGRFPYAYSKHSIDPGTASCIFPCVDDPAMRITWDIHIKSSRTLGDALKRKPSNLARPSKLHSGKKDSAGVLSNGIKTLALEDYEVPLSDEEKILEMVVICSGDPGNEIVDPVDSSKKTSTFSISRQAGVAPQHIGFAIGPFQAIDLADTREEDDADRLGQLKLPVFAYCVPGRAGEVKNTCEAIAQAIDHFTLNFGQHPFEQFSMVFVDDQLHDTEHTAAMALCSARLLVPDGVIEPEYESTKTLVHAAAAQWFGVGIVPEERCDRWLTIGLSHYMAGLFMKLLCGNNEYAFRQKMLADRLIDEDIERPSIHALGEFLNLGPFEKDFMELKAPLVLSILDKRILKASGGISGLNRIISRLIISGNTGLPEESVTNTKDFRRLAEKVTKYRATEPFFNQWIFGTGCPRFLIQQKFNKKRLCVEMTISQKQDTMPTQSCLKRENFPRELKEEFHGIYAGDIQPLFTGPLTIRIHEADGTPYEHVVEIREKDQKIEIPYNTKYKRLKRSRRQKERMNAGANLDLESGDALYYCLGDVLQSAADVEKWKLKDWDPESETKMDMESYEWIRIDADFEWLCHLDFKMPPYMHISQLQQDRDVVAHQQSMLFLASTSGHELVATFLIRTLMDTRYFHGIRTMAAQILRTHCGEQARFSGVNHLEKAYHGLFCSESVDGTKMPRPNDFSGKEGKEGCRVEKAIATALSEARTKNGKCPERARHLLFEMLRFNDNNNNGNYSDCHKIAHLLSCLAESLLSQESDPTHDKDNKPIPEVIRREVEAPEEIEEFRGKVLAELDRYRLMDEYADSYQNIYTTTVLDAYRKLMKSGVIPVNPETFWQYLHDGNSELVKIKGFECLIDLGFITNPGLVQTLLLYLSSDISPYTRIHLFEVFCCGLAMVAFGETKMNEDVLVAEPVATITNGDGDIEMGEADGLVVVEEASTEERKAMIARTTTMEGALVALKAEMATNEVLKTAIWEAIRSANIGVLEQLDLLDICGVLYDAVESMIVKLKMPHYWKAQNLGKGRLVFRHTNKVRWKPKVPIVKAPKPTPTPALVPAPLLTQSAVARPTPPASIRLSLTNNQAGSMKPPKRPAIDQTPSFDERPPKKKRLLITLNVPGAKLQTIQRSTPHPEAWRAKYASSSQSSPAPHQPKPSPRPSPSFSGPSSNAGASNSPTIRAPPALSNSAPPAKTRKPLPDTGRKPLPGSSPAAERKPLPGSSPTERKPLPDINRKPLPGSSVSSAERKPLPENSNRNPPPSSGRKPLPDKSHSSSSPSLAETPAQPPPKKSLKIKLKLGPKKNPSPLTPAPGAST